MKYYTLTKLNQLSSPYSHQLNQIFDYASNSIDAHFSEIEELENSYLIELELAGFKKDEVMLEITKDLLWVKAASKVRGQINKSFALWEDVDAEKIEAVLEDGILRIILNKKQKEVPKKISVK